MLHWGGSEMKIDWKWLCVRFGLLMIEYNYPHTTNTFAKNGKSNIKTAKRFNRNLSEHAPNINGLNHLAAQLRNSFLCSTFIKKSIKRGSTTTGGRWKHTRNWKALSRVSFIRTRKNCGYIPVVICGRNRKKKRSDYSGCQTSKSALSNVILNCSPSMVWWADDGHVDWYWCGWTLKLKMEGSSVCSILGSFIH